MSFYASNLNLETSEAAFLYQVTIMMKRTDGPSVSFEFLFYAQD